MAPEVKEVMRRITPAADKPSIAERIANTTAQVVDRLKKLTVNFSSAKDMGRETGKVMAAVMPEAKSAPVELPSQFELPKGDYGVWQELESNNDRASRISHEMMQLAERIPTGASFAGFGQSGEFISETKDDQLTIDSLRKAMGTGIAKDAAFNKIFTEKEKKALIKEYLSEYPRMKGEMSIREELESFRKFDMESIKKLDPESEAKLRKVLDKLLEIHLDEMHKK